MTISKEQWNGIQNTLCRMYSEVTFRMPSGEEIAVNKSFIAENKMALIVWVNGERSTAWGLPTHEQFRPLVKHVWRRQTRRPGASVIRKISKMKGGKRWLKQKENAHLYDVVEYWVCYFNSAASLVRQYRKIEGLELVTPVSEVMKNAEG
ncbi:hypothetical protein [Citrobacter koseri]|uniref:hypothetical protein n=1 Tax=Citrobacter koseri TaxID=545 RepID=UPI0019069681|nr:hypothetical protein [Citrobacter koseri]MBJ9011194.1 hypothetical protein [Citrobacter koseri]HBA1402913.1 hypothetical protein [Citrobacter koseri]